MIEPIPTLQGLGRRPPVALHPGVPQLDALQILTRHHASGGLVGDADELVGVVTVRQLVYAAQAVDWRHQPIGRIIEHAPMRFASAMTWREAGRVLSKQPREQILIVDPPGRPAALVGLRDLLCRLYLSSESTERPAIEILEANPPILPGRTPASEALAAMAEADTNCVLIGSKRRIDGLVTLSDLRPLLLSGGDLRRSDLISLRHGSTLDQPVDLTLSAALHHLRRSGSGELLISDPAGRPLGRITRLGMLRFLLGEAGRADDALVPPSASCRTFWVCPTVREVRDPATSEVTLEPAIEALVYSEARFRAIFEQAPLGMALLDHDGRILLTNPSFAGLLGQSPDALHRSRLLDWVAIDDQAASADLLRRPFDVGSSGQRYRMRMATRDGAWRACDLVLAPVPKLTGEVVAAVAMVSDVSEHRAALQRLRQAEAVFEATHEGILITDAECRIVAVNRAFCEITGYPEKEVLGRNPRFLQSGEHDAAFYQRMWHAIETFGEWDGEIWNRRRDGEIYPQWLKIRRIDSELGGPATYVALFAELSSAQDAQAADYRAHHDALTGLPNRLLFEARLEHGLNRIARERRRLAVLILNIDRFSHVNDCLGYHLGDDLLREMADRLRAVLPERTRAACRRGGEFVFLCEDLQSTEEPGFLAAELIRALKTPFFIGGHNLFVTASIGISLFPENGDTVLHLCRTAEAALDQVKEAGGNHYQFYTPGLTHLALERLTLEALLRDALAKDEFRLHYQPQVDMETGLWLGAEALIRWHQPDLGLVAPNRFIRLAEESGLMVPLGRWVIDTACAQARTWLDAGFEPGFIAVNLSPAQLLQDDLVATVTKALAASRLPPDRLELEITENLLLDHRFEVQRTLEALGALGVRIAIDDFGTGFSSLTYLKRLPIRSLKIDQSFIRHLPDAEEDLAIVQATIAVAQALGLDAVAEGVAREDQRLLLLTAGCLRGQGSRFAAARPARSLTPGGRFL
ncbi:EAL domain-containing protein [Thioalkalicoccus limnaeus]|uniref:EAL domain-containing protein n=1 Tax=Thioalkalicoccus limnaeus TaxID=120681 RepID=A0ABV4BA74_9GAMM